MYELIMDLFFNGLHFEKKNAATKDTFSRNKNTSKIIFIARKKIMQKSFKYTARKLAKIFDTG